MVQKSWIKLYLILAIDEGLTLSSLFVNEKSIRGGLRVTWRTHRVDQEFNFLGQGLLRKSKE